MTSAEIVTAYNLLKQRTELQGRLASVSLASTLLEVADALTGSGLESTILQRSRTDVSDFLNVAIADVEARITALGVTLEQS